MSESNQLTSTEAVNIIQKKVYQYLKPLGFKKHGRAMHRFVDEDISQVIEFQNGCPQKDVYGVLWVRLGIRVPECDERKFCIKEVKKFYHDYNCNIRCSLDKLVYGEDKPYDLKDDLNEIAEDIIKCLKEYVIPVFDALNSRDAILDSRSLYKNFDRWNDHLIFLEEAMIWGRRGNIEEATRLFNVHYQKVLKERDYKLSNGELVYLIKGQGMIYRDGRTNETVDFDAPYTGYHKIYCASGEIGHLNYLDNLAKELNIPIF